MRRLAILGFLVLTFFGPSRLASGDESILTSKNVISDAWDHFQGDALGGFCDRASQKTNIWGISLLGAVAASTYLTHEFLDDEIGDTVIISKDKTYSDVVDAFSFTAYGTPLIFFVAGAFYGSQDPRRHRNWIVAEEIFETLGFNVVTVYALKFSIDRSNPKGEGGNSFPSGHSSAAFAAATIMAYHYPWYVGLGGLGLATIISLQRFDEREHYPSDLLAGAGIGAFFATAVHSYHAALRNGSTTEKTAWYPLMTQDTLGLVYKMQF